jgi:hypothetical protein
MSAKGSEHGSSPICLAAASTTSASLGRAATCAATSRTVAICRAPMTRSVSSLTTQSMPTTPPSSSDSGLYEKVWYVSSR